MLLNLRCPAMIKIHFPRTLLLSIFCLLVLSGFSNNIQVSNVTLTGRNTASKFTQVQFNLSWENSWRLSEGVGPSNWDAAWVFVKFQVGASNPVFTNVSSSGPTVTVSTTANLRVGMPVRFISGTGALSSSTVISSITSATQFVLSTAPAAALSNASIECIRIWEHAIISSSEANHTAPIGSTITPASDGTGAFIYRSAEGTGTFSLNAVQIRWNYGTNGVRDDALVNVQVFAIEMVYVPQGSFFVGSGGTESGSLTNGSWMSGNTIPFQITSESALGIDNAAGKLWGTSSSGDNTIGNAGADAEASLSAAFPKGFAAFYCMKYEISQGQYRDFLNTLTRSQQSNRVGTSITNGTSSVTNTFVMSNSSSILTRNGIRCTSTIDANNPISFFCDLDGDGSGNESNDGEWIACNFLSWMDAAAFADWAALRPMTELEFEKACRGTQTPVSDEYAWGTSTGTAANNITNSGANNESTNTINANAAFNNQTNVQGPLRVGIFATAASSRVQAGATYYGIMEMSGNLQERTISIGNAEGRAFTGLHGDGILSTNGWANSVNWPGIANGEVTGATGAGLRGGSYANTDPRVSNRSDATQTTTATNRAATYGFRAVRSAQ